MQAQSHVFPGLSFPGAEGRTAVIDMLVLDQFSLMSLAATVEPLRAANRVSVQPLYRWRLFSRDGTAPRSSSGIPVEMHGVFDAEQPRDAVFVVAAFNARLPDRKLAADLRRAARQGATLAGIESGAWALGRAGLLDGYRATTHWEELEEFALAMPNVTVLSDRYVMDRARWTAGGAAPALDMMLAMVRAQHGLALALNVASVFIYDQQQAASAPQPVVSLGLLATRDAALSATIRLMQAHLEEPMPVPILARHAGLSARMLQLRFRAELGMSPYAYYLDLRLAAARRMLQQSGDSVAQVASAYGFGSASAFARAFRARFGVSPVQARDGMGGEPWKSGRRMRD